MCCQYRVEIVVGNYDVAHMYDQECEMITSKGELRLNTIV